MLHRQMTEYTISQVRELQNQRSMTVEVCFAGGELSVMAQWLGPDFVYKPQAEGDLGVRMARSLASALQGTERSVIIGTDCPGLNASILAAAFEQLQLSYDLVLGPAVDGGYYLLGLRYFIPELFIGINWGTSEVLQQTMAIAQQLNLSVNYLPELADVDRPEDLPLWERCQNNL